MLNLGLVAAFAAFAASGLAAAFGLVAAFGLAADFGLVVPAFGRGLAADFGLVAAFHLDASRLATAATHLAAIASGDSGRLGTRGAA